MGQILRTIDFPKNVVNAGYVGVVNQQSAVVVEVRRGLLNPGYMRVLCCEEIERREEWS